MTVRKRALIMLAAGATIGLAAAPASAKCTRLAFSVNDYGKDGPTKDAKALLDKYIADWTAKRGIKKYATSKKDISCELFLDFGLFDEHTCKAVATVCWAEGGTGTIAGPTAGAPAAPSKAPAKSSPSKAPLPAKKKDPA